MEKEVEVLEKEVKVLKAKKAKLDEATKSSFQDGFFLAHHQEGYAHSAQGGLVSFAVVEQAD